MYLFAVHSYSGNSNYANSCYGHWMTDIRLVVIPVTSYEVTAVSQRVTFPASVTVLTTAATMKLTRRRWLPCKVSSRTPHCSSISALGAGPSVCPQGQTLKPVSLNKQQMMIISVFYSPFKNNFLSNPQLNFFNPIFEKDTQF